MDEKQATFDKAVNWVQEASQFMFTKNGFSKAAVAPDRVLLQLSLDIHWTQSEAGAWGWEISENAAQKLLAMNETSLGARQLCQEISAWCLSERRALPEPLRVFSVLFLSGQLKDPPAQRRKEHWLRNQFLIAITWRVAEIFDLELSSGDSTKNKFGACDAVAQGLAQNGYHVRDSAIRHLFHSNKEADVRLRDEAHYWIGQSKRIKAERPDIAATWKEPPKPM